MAVVNKGLPAKCCGSGVEERQAIKAGTELRSPTGPDALACLYLQTALIKLFSLLALFTNNGGYGHEDAFLNQTLHEGGMFLIRTRAFIS